jgi:mRNA-degrading endonuclease RelE of RelBE toxin-antitoxin system
MIIKFREKFEKDIDNITNQGVLNDISDKIEEVENAIKPQDIKNIKKMKGHKTAFRIGIFIIKNVVEFTRVLPRDKIYNYFPD